MSMFQARQKLLEYKPHFINRESNSNALRRGQTENSIMLEEKNLSCAIQEL